MGVRTASGALRVSLLAVLLAAYVTAVGRRSGQDELVVGTHVINRPPEFMRVVGWCANTLGVRIERYAPSLDFVRDVNGVAMEALLHQHVPYRELAQSPDVRRHITRHMFNLAHAFSLELPGLSCDALRRNRCDTRSECDIRVIKAGATLEIELAYPALASDDSEAERVLDDYFQALEDLVMMNRRRGRHRPRGMSLQDHKHVNRS